MKRYLLTCCLTLLICISSFANPPHTISLNGTWDFDQTTSAFPPTKFSRKIPVPGLIHLATPRIEEYDKFFKRAEKVTHKTTHSALDVDYTPKYSWYRKKVVIGREQKNLEAVLTIKKSQYVTQVFVNGIDLGTYIECYTPIDVAITRALKYGQENEILIKVGDRYWLPSQAAGSTDKEKEHYLPGIWDDVSLSFTNKLRVNRALVLPSLKDKKVIVKTKIWNLNPSQLQYNGVNTDSLRLQIKIYEKKSKALIAEFSDKYISIRDRNTEINCEIPVKSPHPWTPEAPFLYTAEVSVYYNEELSDKTEENFGMRDFERRGKSFYLNGEKIYLRGSNITLQRFFEDPDCSDLVWDKAWVKKMFIDMPKDLDWNAMRVCVGIVPDFWYDLADEYGLLLQNEWLYWQNHGWDDQIRKEYTDWVWADGSHPSIVIWDAINENWNDYIGNELIPELRILDPTRIWDAGYMTASSMAGDDMDEPHPYMGHRINAALKKNPYPLGDLDYRPDIIKHSEESSSAQLVNEYGWVWLWRDGTPSKLTVPIYDYYMGTGTTVDERRNFQAYWLQCETEWLRSNRSIAGVLAFCHLTNNYGYTGDWFVGNIKNLTPGPTLYWFKHCFAATNVFLNVTDERYAKGQAAHAPGSYLNFTLRGVNDAIQDKSGSVTIKLLNSQGKSVYSNTIAVGLPASDRIDIPYAFTLPTTADGYLLLTEFTEEGKSDKLVSRRYLKVGNQQQYKFYEMPVPDKFLAENAK